MQGSLVEPIMKRVLAFGSTLRYYKITGLVADPFSCCHYLTESTESIFESFDQFPAEVRDVFHHSSPD